MKVEPEVVIEEEVVVKEEKTDSPAYSLEHVNATNTNYINDEEEVEEEKSKTHTYSLEQLNAVNTNYINEVTKDLTIAQRTWLFAELPDGTLNGKDTTRKDALARFNAYMHHIGIVDSRGWLVRPPKKGTEQKKFFSSAEKLAASIGMTLAECQVAMAADLKKADTEAKKKVAGKAAKAEVVRDKDAKVRAWIKMRDAAFTKTEKDAADLFKTANHLEDLLEDALREQQAEMNEWKRVSGAVARWIHELTIFRLE